MVYGPTPPRALPRQDQAAILLHTERFVRSSAALALWSEKAKKCVEYFEGDQWNERDRALLQKQKRPALTINKIKPLVELVRGYHLNNRTDIRYLPGHDGTGTAETAAALTHLAKQISEASQLPAVDGDVFLDGILTGRGFYECYLDFSENDLGEIRWRAVDPFSVYLDPDAEDYDLNSGNFVMTSRFVSVDEIEYCYGAEAAALVAPLVDGMTYSALPSGLSDGVEEMTPFRKFGGGDDQSIYWSTYGQQFYDWVDRARKTIRLVDIQHYVRVPRWYFVDLETGDRKPVPDHWSPSRIQKVLAWAAEQGDPLVVVRRPGRRLRWTHMVGDRLLYDEWSPYESFTLTPFFPYFRRGRTKGMIDDLLDPQDEVNKRRSARLNIIGRSAAGGWMYPKGSLDAQAKINLELYGSTPGVHVEWDSKDGRLTQPQQIQPAQSPVAITELEHEAEDDLKKIAGINDSALGHIDRVQSGRAIEARQRQTIVGLESFMANYARTKELCGRMQLEVIQNHYTEERVIRATGGGGRPETIIINQRTAAGIMNNVTLGRYAVAVDESPLSKTFLEGQFEELARMKGEMGMPIPDDFLIDASSIARKEELKAMMRVQRQLMQQAAMLGLAPPEGEGQGPGPGGSRVDQNGGSLPAGEPGEPQPTL